ncbi:MAG: hypothetical protein Q9225_007774 [Loekoesia sp. 1 TL-2023]
MAPLKSLPFPSNFASTDAYVESLLVFVTSSELFQKLCGGVHILDFLTQDPDLYTTLFPKEWRQFFDLIDISDILDLLMRVDLATLNMSEIGSDPEETSSTYYSGSIPPASLVEYIRHVHSHSLDRNIKSSRLKQFPLSDNVLAKHVAVGMKPKKIHEVSNLAVYVDNLAVELSSEHSCQVSHFVDFGSGQNYLGRALASPPYERKVIAIESKPLNIDGARTMDVTAKLAKKEVVLRNKKEYRRRINGYQHCSGPSKDISNPTSCPSMSNNDTSPIESGNKKADHEDNIQYIQTIIQDGNLSSFLSRLPQPPSSPHQNLIVISLHSCGNLLHHGLRSLTLNPSVRAVALVGCCYNLLTERLPPSPTQNPPPRSTYPRLQQTSSACDPHGFPMSECFLNYKHPRGPGIRFNITARMMAVQAPQNWTEKDCESFFTRHFYRALFQKILVDKGVVRGPKHPEDTHDPQSSNIKQANQPIILGSLRKQHYTSFTTYIRAAITKLQNDPIHAEKITKLLSGISDEEIKQYETDYGHKKKQLGIVWSLMAFSAGVIESAIVVDRWLWLREQREVKECWVESVFDYGVSPRNLVVVGVKG